MVTGKTAYETLYRLLVQLFGRLIYLKDLLTFRDIVTTDGERYHHLYIIGLCKLSQLRHLFRIERAKDEVTLICSFHQQRLADISVNVHIPGMNVNGDTLLLQVVNGKQNPSVELHHAPSVAIHVMQRKHNAHTHFALAHIRLAGCHYVVNHRENH